MKKLDLGQTLGILANLGVIAGIIFLAFELRQNNQLLVAQTSYAQFNVVQQRRLLQIQESETLMKPEESRTGAERLRVNLIYNNTLDSFIWQFREYEAGRLPDDFIDLRIWRDVWRSQSALRDLYAEDRSRLDPEFIMFFEENVVNAHE